MAQTAKARLMERESRNMGARRAPWGIVITHASANHVSALQLYEWRLEREARLGDEFRLVPSLLSEGLRPRPGWTEAVAAWSRFGRALGRLSVASATRKSTIFFSRFTRAIWTVRLSPT